MNITTLTCRLCLSLLFISVISGCRTLPEKPVNTTDDNSYPEATSDDSLTSDTAATTTTTDVTESLPSPLRTHTFPTNTLYSLLVAEVAASRRQYATTIGHYVEQAKETGDKSIIIRAARVTQFLRVHKDSIDMGQLWLEQEPKNKEALTIVANAYIELQQPLNALNYTERLIENHYSGSASNKDQENGNGTDGGALVETLANYSRKSPAETLLMLTQRIERLSNTYPALAGIKVGLSTLHQAAGQPKSARDWIDRALTQEPTRTTAIIQDVRLLQSTQQNPLALTKLEQYVKDSPNNHRLRLVYARLLSQSNIPQAYIQFTKLSEQTPQQADLRFSRALLATELEKMDVALPLFESLLAENYQADNVNFYLGHIHSFQQEADIALKYYVAVKQGSNYLPSQYRIAKIYLNNQKIEKARILFRRLHEKLPDNTEQLYENEASLLVQHKADSGALALLDKAIALFPDNPTLRYERASIYERQDKLDLMEKDFRHVLAQDPNNVAALNGLGYLLTIRTTRYDDAHLLISKALELTPRDPSIIDSMGWVLFKKGQIKEAIVYLQKAYQQFPDPEVAAHLSEALWVNGEQDAAKAILQESLTTNPGSEETLDILRRLGITL
jgi:tetratricopeptide (TPR) repeat protein